MKIQVYLQLRKRAAQASDLFRARSDEKDLGFSHGAKR
jgi:hypothetical protein